MNPNGKCPQCGDPARIANVDLSVEEEGLPLPRPREIACTNRECGNYKPGRLRSLTGHPQLQSGRPVLLSERSCG